eukprot:146757-Amorphochlora_amoeboformis.AAC.1
MERVWDISSEFGQEERLQYRCGDRICYREDGLAKVAQFRGGCYLRSGDISRGSEAYRRGGSSAGYDS